MKLERINDEVFFEGKKLTIVAQATKGPGKEVVKIEGLPGSNGQKWISLKRLEQGINEIQCEAREVTVGAKYKLTAEEQTMVNEYQAKIDEIIEGAKARYIPNLDKFEKMDFSTLSDDERARLKDFLIDLIERKDNSK
jgi:hypothetical protein